MKYLVIILIFSLSLFSASFQRDKGRELVLDTQNNLMWVDDDSSQSLYLTHEEAQDYCSSLKHAGYENWRLATIKEFEFIVDKKNHPNYINKIFKFAKNSGYWASKAHWRTLWFYADYMHFVSGTPYFDNRKKKKLVRCIRDTR